MSETRVEPPARLDPEDRARADFYALLGRLYADPPDATLLAAIANAPPLAPVASAAGGDDIASALSATWDSLRTASAGADPHNVGEEFMALFVGVGRSEVSLYASHYLGPQSGRPLAEIRAALSELGLARRPGSSEFEDHLSVVLETMRMLVGGDGERPPAQIAQQRSFFDRHLATWVTECCTAIVDSPVANYYCRVAQFCSCFMALERDSLAMD
jgi:TorA maturation chaperone TorD